jgi:hypothetical protein
MKDIQARNDALSELKQTYAYEKRELLHSMDSMKIKYQEVNDELMKIKLEYNRDSALGKQESEFQGRKIDELVKMCEEQSTKFDKTVGRLTIEREGLEKKLEELKDQ